MGCALIDTRALEQRWLSASYACRQLDCIQQAHQRTNDNERAACLRAELIARVICISVRCCCIHTFVCSLELDEIKVCTLLVLVYALKAGQAPSAQFLYTDSSRPSSCCNINCQTQTTLVLVSVVDCDSGGMQLFVKVLDGHHACFNAPSGATTADLKLQIQVCCTASVIKRE